MLGALGGAAWGAAATTVAAILLLMLVGILGFIAGFSTCFLTTVAVLMVLPLYFVPTVVFGAAVGATAVAAGGVSGVLGARPGSVGHLCALPASLAGIAPACWAFALVAEASTRNGFPVGGGPESVVVRIFAGALLAWFAHWQGERVGFRISGRSASSPRARFV